MNIENDIKKALSGLKRLDLRKSKGPWKKGKQGGYDVIHTSELDTHPAKKNIGPNDWHNIRAGIATGKDYHVVSKDGGHKMSMGEHDYNNAKNLGLFRTKEESKHDVIGKGPEYKGTKRKVKHGDGSVTTVTEHESYGPVSKAFSKYSDFFKSKGPWKKGKHSGYTGDHTKDFEDTALMPHAVADSVAGKISQHIGKPELEQHYHQHLMGEFDRAYKNNKKFGQSIREDNEGSRDKLHSFMHHWAASHAMKSGHLPLGAGVQYQRDNGALAKSFDTYADFFKSQGPWKHKHPIKSKVDFNHPKRGKLQGTVIHHDINSDGEPIYGIHYTHKKKEGTAWRNEKDISSSAEKSY